MMISKQSLRMSRISLRQHSSSALSLPSGKTPVVRGARACTVCRAAKVCISAYPIPRFVSHHHHVDEMCWCGRRLSTLSTLQAHRCRVCACQTLFLTLLLTCLGVCLRGTDAAESRAQSSFDFGYPTGIFFYLNMQAVRGFQNVETTREGP